jgi:hypothetical protein
MENTQISSLDENRLIVPPDVKLLKKSYDDNYAILKNKHFVFYPRKTFHKEGIPSPRQYLAYRGLIEAFDGKDDFLTSDIRAIDLRTPYIMIIDDYYDLFHSNIIKNCKLINTSGVFYAAKLERRAKMVNFLKDMAGKGCAIELHTQCEELERYFFYDQYSNNLRDRIKITYVYYRIDIHYTILEHPKNRHYFLELPHSEEFIFRVGIHFTDEYIIKLGCDPDKIYNYLIGLRESRHSEKFFHAVKEKLPWLKAPDIGLAVHF